METSRGQRADGSRHRQALTELANLTKKKKKQKRKPQGLAEHCGIVVEPYV